MQFTGLSGTEFTLLFSGAAFLAVVFYLLSFRRRIAIVAAEPIWRKVLGKKRTPFRKLLALLLQILVLFLLSMTAADPRIPPAATALAVAQVLIVDTSASMSAFDGHVYRIDQARDLASKIADSMGPSDRLILLAMNDRCLPLTGWTGDRKIISKAVDSIEHSSVPEDFNRCIGFGQRALDSNAFGHGFQKRIAVVSDHFHQLPDSSPYPILQVSVGSPVDNLAITAFEIRLRAGATSAYEIFAQVNNFGISNKRATLSIHTEKSLLGEQVLTIPAHQARSRSYLLKPLDERRIMASITSAKGRGGADGFSLDNRAYALLPTRKKNKVLLVTNGNLYLEKALELVASIDVQIVAPSAFSASLIEDKQVIVFDGPCIEVDKPAIYFAPVPGGSCPFDSADEVEFPKLLPLKGDHPVTEGVTLVDIRIDKATHIVPIQNDVELLQDKDGPLLIARQQGEKKSVAFGFDISQSDLPLRIAFPILMHNCISWFLGQQTDIGGSEHRIGSPVWLPQWAQDQAIITGPDKRISHPLILGTRTVFRPRLAGFYDIASKGNSLQKAVNFYTQEESSLAYRQHTGPERITWQAGQAPAALISNFDTRQTDQSPAQWPTVLLAVAWLLVFDWLFFCFRILF